MFKKIVFSGIIVCLVLGSLEGGLRLVGFEYQPRQRVLWKPTVAGFQGTFEFYINTEFDPPGYIWLSERNTAYTDRYGFRRPEISYRKPRDKVRIAFLGGSTTQGGYRPYPERTVKILNDALGTDRYEALNAACSSYSTHQNLIALERWVRQRNPDIVCLYEGWNDCTIQSDGFSDASKDSLVGASTHVAPQFASWLRQLRVAQFVGKVIDALNPAWPSPRVAPAAFRTNLEKFVGVCRTQGYRAIVFTRPPWRRHPLPPIGPEMMSFYGRRYGTPNAAEILDKIHTEYAGLQRALAAANSDVRLFDASAVVSDIVSSQRSGEFGDGVGVYHADGLHLVSFAEQRLAERLALFMVPEETAAIEAHIHGAAYLASLARESLAEDYPHDAVYYARRAIAVDPHRSDEMEALIQQAEAQFEFSRLFEEGKWGGSDQNFESKTRKLRLCLEQRPHDLGVAIQIFRVCVYMSQLDKAADLLNLFQPDSPEAAYEWHRMELESHAVAERWDLARSTALEILKLQPQDPAANAVMQAGVSSRTGGD